MAYSTFPFYIHFLSHASCTHVICRSTLATLSSTCFVECNFLLHDRRALLTIYLWKRELYSLYMLSTSFRIHVDHAESKTLLKELWIIKNRIWSGCQTSWIWRNSPRKDGIYKYIYMCISWKKIRDVSKNRSSRSILFSAGWMSFF